MKDLIVLALADYRLSLIISKDDISKGARSFIGRRAAGSERWKFLADLVNCPFCVGVWGAAFLVLIDRFRIGRVFSFVLAVAGLQDAMQGLIWGEDENEVKDETV